MTLEIWRIVFWNKSWLLYESENIVCWKTLRKRGTSKLIIEVFCRLGKILWQVRWQNVKAGEVKILTLKSLKRTKSPSIIRNMFALISWKFYLSKKIEGKKQPFICGLWTWFLILTINNAFNATFCSNHHIQLLVFPVISFINAWHILGFKTKGICRLLVIRNFLPPSLAA